MSNSLTSDQEELFSFIDEILWLKWDPIGVNDIEGARDEYSSYVPHIFRLAVEGKDPATIGESLIATIEGNMGLSANREFNYGVATEIVAAKQMLLDEH